MTTGLLITTAGQAAIAADLAGGADLVLSHVAFGDSNGIPYAPNEAQTALVNERYRSTIASVAVVAGAIVVDAVIPADTPDGAGRASHGFNVAEAGLYSAAGTLIGVARMGNGYKPSPSSGQAQIATFRLKLAVANPAAITVVIDAQAQVSVGRNVRPFWLAVDGLLNAPPGAPAIGATFVIGAAPTGAWAGFPHRLAQWVGVWALAVAPEGHHVCDASKAEGDASRYMRRTSTGWTQARATTALLGFTRLATSAEATAGTAQDVAVTPSGLGAGVTTSLQNLVIIADHKAVGVNGGDFMAGAWRTRDLNTIVADPNNLVGQGLVALAANRLTLTAGIWLIEASAPACAVNSHKSRLQNITDAATAIWGSTEQTTQNTNTDQLATRSELVGRIELADAKQFELQHICEQSSTGFAPGVGFGIGSVYLGGGVPEVYSIVTLRKIG